MYNLQCIMYGICACTLTYLEEEAGIASNPGPLSRARAQKRRKSERAWDSSENLGNVVWRNAYCRNPQVYLGLPRALLSNESASNAYS